MLRLLFLILCILAVRATSTPEGFLQVEEFRGVPRWQLLPTLWKETTLQISCQGVKEFNVYIASSKDALVYKFTNQDRAWCGFSWQGLTSRKNSQPPACVVQISPFGTTYVAVGRSKHATVWGTQGTPRCTVQASQQFNPLLLIQGIIGTLLFLYARQLAASQPFRLSLGTIALTVGSLAVLAMMLSRLVHGKAKLLAAMAMFGTSLMSVSHWLFGAWIPSLAQLMHSKVVWAYLTISALASFAVTYYFDSHDNYKLHNILKWSMKLLGLGAVATSTTLPEASVSAAGVLVVVDALWKLLGRQQQAALEASAWRVVHSVARSPITPRWLASPLDSAHKRSSTTAPRTAHRETGGTPGERGGPSNSPAEGSPLVGGATSPLVQRGLILNEETGRTIQIGKATYTGLVDRGYVVDKVRGVITPPPSGGGRAGRPRSRLGLD